MYGILGRRIASGDVDGAGRRARRPHAHLLADIFERNWIDCGYGEYLSAEELRELAVDDVLTLISHLDGLQVGTVVGRSGWCGGVEVRLAA